MLLFGYIFHVFLLRFFKDRRYVDKEWGHCFSVSIYYTFVGFFFIWQFMDDLRCINFYILYFYLFILFYFRDFMRKYAFHNI
jgi:hypothetical protein